MAGRRKENDFWIEERPFGFSFDEEYEGELEEIAREGLPELLGWLPRGLLSFYAMCSGTRDHRLLAELCIRFCRELGGIVDFGGMVLPEPNLDGSAPSLAVRVIRPSGIGGTLFATSCLIDKGRYGTSHYGDLAFLEAWLLHPDFAMVK